MSVVQMCIRDSLVMMLLGKSDLSGADFSGAHIQMCTLQEANVTGARFRKGRIEQNALQKAACSGADFSGATLIRLVFSDSDMRSLCLLYTSGRGRGRSQQYTMYCGENTGYSRQDPNNCQFDRGCGLCGEYGR